MIFLLINEVIELKFKLNQS